MKVTYIQHSGFAVEYRDIVLIFDYYKGDLPEFDSGRKLYVFSSHAHFDHFNRHIFTWKKAFPDITYILSDDITAKGPDGHVVAIGPEKERRIGDIQVRTLRSTDEGVAFLVTADDRVIYHAGDLNWWHWEEEGSLYNQFMKKNYKRIIGKLKDRKIDAAFVPVDPRLQDAYYWGMDRFMRVTDTRYVFPMHMQGKYELYEKLMEQPETEEYRDRIMHITGQGQVFELPD